MNSFGGFDNMGECSKIIHFESLDTNVKELIKEAAKAREHAYSPYSKFQVGAALRCADGTILRGCNVENASFSATICAERTAIVKAISEGKRTFEAISIVASHKKNSFVSPCGLCRQTLMEFGDIPIYISKPDMQEILATSVKELLPFPFQDSF